MGFYAAIPFFANLSFTSKFINFSLILFFSSSFTVGRERQRVRGRERVGASEEIKFGEIAD